MSTLDAALALEARREMWRRNRAADYLLDTSGPTGGQQAWVKMLDATPAGAWSAWEISRQRGKTWTALAWATQRLGLRRIQAVYVAQTGANAEAIVRQFVKDIGDDLPPEWGARFVDGAVRFENGSELVVFGTDNQQHRRSRGRRAEIVLLDEAGFFQDLLDVEQVYQPQLQTTGGVGLYLSSPALNPTHEFSRRCDAAAAVGRYVKDSFWSNPRIDHEAVIRGEMERLGLTREQLLASTAFRREYLAERVTEENRAAVPAWARMEAQLVGDWVRPTYFDAYTILDPGKIGDPHAALFAYLDMESGHLVVEDELELKSSTHTVAAWAKAIKEKESALWGVDRWEGTLLGADEWHRMVQELPEYLRRSVSSGAPRQPFLRAGDNEHLVLNTLNVEHGLAVCPVPKHEKHLAVDALNELVVAGKVRVHRRCARTREQLLSTLWNKTRTQWERTDKDHGDLIDDLVYLARICRWHRDVRPKTSAGPAPQQRASNGWAAAFARR